MFKFFRKKIIEGFIKDAISELPKIGDAGLKYLKEHKDEIVDQLILIIKNAVCNFISELNEKTNEKK